MPLIGPDTPERKTDLVEYPVLHAITLCLSSPVVLSLVQLERREWAVVYVTEQHEVHVCRGADEPLLLGQPARAYHPAVFWDEQLQGVVSTPPNMPEHPCGLDRLLEQNLDLYLKILIRRVLLHLFQKGISLPR